MKTVDVVIPIPRERMECALITAFEGGSNYWFSNVRSLDRDKNKDVYERCLDSGFTITDRETGKNHTVTAEGLVKALSLMAQKQPRHFGDLISERDDATTGDVYLQLAVFGEVIYG